jgi:hypothetical protein
MFTKSSLNTLLTSCILLFSTSLLAQNQDEMMKKWMDYMTPSPIHELLAKSVGEWDYQSKWWNDPTSEPMASSGKAVDEMILGGRYLKSTTTGSVMGMPMEGISIVAYDNATKVVMNFWIDNMGTGMTIARGKYDEKSKTFNLKGTMVDPMTGKDVEYRETMKFIDDKHHLLEMFITQDGNEFKMMEMTYSRK